MGSTSEAGRSCTQVSLGACRLAQLLGVLQSGGAGALSAGSLQEINNNVKELRQEDLLCPVLSGGVSVDPGLPALIAMVVPATIPMAAMPLLRGAGTGTGAG